MKEYQPNFFILTFGYDILSSINSIDFIKTDPFPYCKTGFKYKNLKVNLCNVPIYDTENEDDNLIPSETSGLTTCYLPKDDFVYYKNGKRVKVYFDDEIRSHRVGKYVNFNDLHKMKRDLYVKNTLLTTNIDEKTLDGINEMEKNIKEIIEKRKSMKFKKRKLFALFKDKLKLTKNSIEYFMYAYACEGPINTKDFIVHKTQIYAVFEASKMLFKNDSLSEKILLKQKQILDDYINKVSNDNLVQSNEYDLMFDQSLNSEIRNLLNESLSTDKTSLRPTNYDNKKKFFAQKYKESVEKRLSEKNYDDSKGIIYQVETGEGKSCIISLIAAILASIGKNVHIASSNIKLANRDYMESFDFFQSIDFRTAVLLHDNELPYDIKKVKKDLDPKNEKEISVDESQIEEKYYNDSSDSDDNDDDQNIKIKTKMESDDNNDDDDDDNDDELADKIEIETDNNKNSNISLDDSYDLTDSKVDSLFKENVQNYFDSHTQEASNSQYLRYYLGTYKNKKMHYYDEDQFKNPSHMNFAVCGLDCDNKIPKKKPDIVYSTFVNFECFYLKMLEICPGYVNEYFNDTVLIVDEADSILIDEIANGTIVSKEMKSNIKEFLTFIYKNKMNGASVEDTFEAVSQIPKCFHLKLEDIQQMYAEIDLVTSNDFVSGKKYLIKDYVVKNEKKKNKLMKKTLDFATGIGVKVGKGLIKELMKNDNEDGNNDDDDDDDDDDDEDDDNDDDDDSPETVFKYIVPYDFDHKGILEPNKEFNGFIHQFIAINEREKNKVENMIIKDMSMSYLYVSHPIFVKLYSKVCGFTGTLGNNKDLNIYKEQYNLRTKRIPRNKPNERVELPKILCNSIQERNQKIVDEICEFHKRENPVLVIFQNPNEIDDVGKLLIKRGICFYNKFDGIDELVSPKIIAGLKSAVSLGTNVCGRGTDIITAEKPLHVIISYYTSNSRVIDQARGRTARQGRKGTTRIICHKDDYLYPQQFTDIGIEAVIEEFRIKDQMQTEYINIFKALKPFIFSNSIQKQDLKDSHIIQMRQAKINVNRIVAYKFAFPLKMNILTFLNIQAQRIFSLLNCPNTKYTWMLFQRYVREMIFESWSLMIKEVDEIFFRDKFNQEYKKKLEEFKKLNFDKKSAQYKIEVEKLNSKFKAVFINYENTLKEHRNQLLKKIDEYLPFKIHHIIDSFMHIFNLVVNRYESRIVELFGTKSRAYIQNNKIGFMSVQIGLKPYKLLTESGARINSNGINKINYIKDPELRYLKKMPNNKFSIFSITETIDDIFNSIFQTINKMLGNKAFLKFFLRRTLCGCEFGICLDFPMKSVYSNNNFDSFSIYNSNCIIDKDPLILFSISIRSLLPVLAGVLIFLLIYAAYLAKDIIGWFALFPEKLTKAIVTKGVFIIIDALGSSVTLLLLNKLVSILKNILNKQLDKLNNPRYKDTFDTINDLLTIFDSETFENINKKISSKFGTKIRINFKWQEIIKNCIHPEKIILISLLLILCLVTFFVNFDIRENAIDLVRKCSDIFINKKQSFTKDKEKIEQTITNLVNEKENQEALTSIIGKEKINPEHDIDLLKKVEESNNEIMKTSLYKYKQFNLLKFIVKLTDFIDSKNDNNDDNLVNDISDGISYIKNCIQQRKDEKRLCTRLCFSGSKEIFMEQVHICAMIKFPSILEFVGYSIHKGKKNLFVIKKGSETLESILFNKNHVKIKPIQKAIIAYGIAEALEYLHKNKFVHRNLKPINIIIDKKFHPYLTGFYFAIQTEAPPNYTLIEMTPEFMPPEFIQNYGENQCSFKIDVYSYGIVLFMLLTETNPFSNCMPSNIKKNTVDGKRPEFPVEFNEDWKKLIEQCWDQDCNKRPDFADICNTLEKTFLNNKHFIKYQNKINQNKNRCYSDSYFQSS